MRLHTLTTKCLVLYVSLCVCIVNTLCLTHTSFFCTCAVTQHFWTFFVGVFVLFQELVDQQLFSGAANVCVLHFKVCEAKQN